ncbi:MAG: cytochrome c-type biogenesis protein [Usitatibacter sp.]
MKTRIAIGALALAASQLVHGQASEIAKPDPLVESRLRSLGEELRCLVCQNQTIADSNAPLAHDLRTQIREQIARGRSDGDIRDYMVERYGDFVLYRPPLRSTTVLLWLGPFALLLGGAGVFVYTVRRRRSVAAKELPISAQRRETIEALLDGAEPTSSAPAPARKKGASA